MITSDSDEDSGDHDGIVLHLNVDVDVKIEPDFTTGNLDSRGDNPTSESNVDKLDNVDVEQFSEMTTDEDTQECHPDDHDYDPISLGDEGPDPDDLISGDVDVDDEDPDQHRQCVLQGTSATSDPCSYENQELVVQLEHCQSERDRLRKELKRTQYKMTELSHENQKMSASLHFHKKLYRVLKKGSKNMGGNPNSGPGASEDTPSPGDECFHILTEADDSRRHYEKLLQKKDADLAKVESELAELKLSKLSLETQVSMLTKGLELAKDEVSTRIQTVAVLNSGIGSFAGAGSRYSSTSCSTSTSSTSTSRSLTWYKHMYEEMRKELEETKDDLAAAKSESDCQVVSCMDCFKLQASLNIANRELESVRTELHDANACWRAKESSFKETVQGLKEFNDRQVTEARPRIVSVTKLFPHINPGQTITRNLDGDWVVQEPPQGHKRTSALFFNNHNSKRPRKEAHTLRPEAESESQSEPDLDLNDLDLDLDLELELPPQSTTPKTTFESLGYSIVKIVQEKPKPRSPLEPEVFTIDDDSDDE